MQRQLSHSQNFLINPEVAKRLVELSGISSNDFVLEIGPGRGIITKEILNVTKHFVGIEFDATLYAELKDTFEGIINEDFMTYVLPHIPFHVISNIPFNMTSDILKKLLGNPSFISATLIVQKEAIERYFPATTQISVEYMPFFDFEVIGGINRGDFSPVPSVDIVFAKITRKAPLVKERSSYASLVEYVFNSWKGNVLKVLDTLFTQNQVFRIKKDLKISTQKPSELTVEQWLKLYDVYEKLCPDTKKREVLHFAKRHQILKESLHKKHRTSI